MSGQFRGALVISLQPARNAPQQETHSVFRSGAEAVWANSAGATEPHGLFHISGEGLTREIDTERAQWRRARRRGYGRVVLSPSSDLRRPRQVFPPQSTESNAQRCRSPHTTERGVGESGTFCGFSWLLESFTEDYISPHLFYELTVLVVEIRFSLVSSIHTNKQAPENKSILV